MRLIVGLLLIHLLFCVDAKSSKKVVKDEATAVLNKKILGKPKPITSPAIIAIEIVDPNENKTSSKNSKRTIDQSLGYGYQSYGYRAPPPKFQVYKYSQHDIPAYKGNLNSHNYFSGGIKSHQYDIQQSVSYKLPSSNSGNQHQSLNQYYQPGTTLFSTINNHGQVGGLSTQLPQIPQSSHYSQEPQVPVIILRVLPSQLNDPSAVLHPNLPQSHPLAATINSIDIQSLLSKYVQNLLVPANNNQHNQPEIDYHNSNHNQAAADYQNHQPVEISDNYHYQYQDQAEYSHQEQPQYQYQYQESNAHADSSSVDEGLLTHENYPKETHTRVIFRTDKNNLGITPSESVAIPQLHTQTLPANQAYSSVDVQTPHMQYSYQSNYDHNDQQNQNYYYTPQEPQPFQQTYYQQQQQESVNHLHQKRSRTKGINKEMMHQSVLKLKPIKA